MPLVKALAAQLCALAIVMLIARSGLFAGNGPWPPALAQGGLAAMAAWLMRSDTWWLPIHALFVPALLAASLLALAPHWYLAAFVLLALVYWSTFRTRVPLFLSNRQTVAAVSRLLEARAEGALLDIGSGTGSLLRPLARTHPGWRLVGIESAPLPHWLSRWLARGQPNIRLARGDFFAADWGDFDVIYAFLSPVPMARVWAKACREMKPGALVVSNAFPIPEVAPGEVIEVGDRRATRLYVYRPASGKRRKGR
ncbi:MAG: class I SAM-dependent methyltransferase [Rhodocyclaceae bacterium]|nr:class I SAM-dependent methyltransferase [Rhodocyclaceae bacterium]